MRNPLPVSIVYMIASFSIVFASKLVGFIMRRPGQSQGLLYKQRRHNWLTEWPFPPMASQRCLTQNVRNNDCSKKNRICWKALENSKFQRTSKLQHCIGSQIMSILLNRLIWPIGGVLWVWVLQACLLWYFWNHFKTFNL